MKKSILIFTGVILLFFSGFKTGLAQDQPKPKKDTVNIDTDAKPTFYYAEDETSKSKSKFPTVPVVAGVVVLLAAGAYILLKKKK